MHYTPLLSLLQVKMADASNCTFIEATSHSFIVRQSIKQVIALTLILLHKRLLYILVRDREQFNNTFYKLIIMNGFAVCAVQTFERSNSVCFQSCVCHFTFYPASRVPVVVYLLGIDHSFLKEGSFLLSISVFLWYYSAMASFIGSFLMALNRMSAIAQIKTFVASQCCL